MITCSYSLFGGYISVVKVQVISVDSLMLAACSFAPSEEDIQKAIEETNAAIPTNTAVPTETPIPLSDIDLEGILLLDGDLPPEFIGKQIISDHNINFTNIPTPIQFKQRKITHGVYSGDGVIIALYEEPEDIEEAFEEFINEAEKFDAVMRPVKGVGEKAMIAETWSAGVPLKGGGGLPPTYDAKILFIKCNAVVYIDLFAEYVDLDIAMTYAKRLDDRLSTLVCAN